MKDIKLIDRIISEITLKKDWSYWDNDKKIIVSRISKRVSELLKISMFQKNHKEKVMNYTAEIVATLKRLNLIK